MNKAYTPTKQPLNGFIGSHAVFVGLFVYFSWQGALSWTFTLAAVVVLMLAHVGVHKFLASRGAWLRISETRIETKRAFGGTAVVDDVRDYFLVISTDWVAFRRKGQQDIMVNEGTFDPNVWQELLNDLKALPFKGIV